MSFVGSTPSANNQPSLIPPADPSHAVKRTRSESSLPEEAPPSKRQRTDDWMVLCENSGSFYPIPNEIINHILSCCKASALVRMGTTCRRFLYVTDRAPMWKELCEHAKLSVKEEASYRLAFLSAIAQDNFDAHCSRARFFSNGKYTNINNMRALTCWDQAINIDAFWNGTKFSDRQITAVLKKAKMFFSFEDFRKTAFVPGQIDTIYSQLESIITFSHSPKIAAQARLLQTVMKINDPTLIPITYSSIWNALNTIRQSEQASKVRDRAGYMQAFLRDFKQNHRWERSDLGQFRGRHLDLPNAERAKIFKQCIKDSTAPLWCHQIAKILLVLLRRSHNIEEITDEEAYEMLQSLKKAPFLISTISMNTVDVLIEEFRTRTMCNQ